MKKFYNNQDNYNLIKEACINICKDYDIEIEEFLINPTGRFEIGGFEGDSGLTGRKIIVDTYGGYACHGGGAFSGKDPTKVDRSACYAARYVAKNIVASGIAKKCQVQLAYAIGVAKPVSILINTFGTGKVSDEEITKLRRFIEFYMPKPRFTSRAKDKEKKLNKILENKIEIEKERHKNINLNLQSSNLKNKELLCIKNVVVGYDTPLLKEISFDIYSNDKIAIMGDNGIGKSTLIKTIYGMLKPLHGEILSKRKLNIGYFNQFDLEKEDSKQTILEYLRNNNLNLSDKELRSALGKFYFKGDDINKNLFSTSNGERKRLLLCNLSLKSYDLLLLDEPANHLDLDTKKSLIDSLNKYNGVILFISHDRFFVNQLASKLIYLTKNKNYIIEGNYDDLLIDLEKENSENNIAKENKEQLVEKNSAKPQQNNKLSKNMIVKLQSEVKQIELRLSEINEILTNASYTSYEEVDELVNEKEKLETKYLDLLSKLEENNENG